MVRKTGDATKEFFEGLAKRGHEPLVGSVSGTLRFDLKDGRRVERWYLTIRKGDLAVSKKNAEADAVVHAEKADFDSIATGKLNAAAATLRGLVQPEGNLKLVIMFQRLLPGPSGRAR
jgi:putative sterol carrier protein